GARLACATGCSSVRPDKGVVGVRRSRRGPGGGEMVDQAKALESARWWVHFVNGDLKAVESCLAPDVLRIGPRPRDANHEMRGRDNYIGYMADLLKTMPRLNESVAHDTVLSPDGRRAYLHF